MRLEGLFRPCDAHCLSASFRICASGALGPMLRSRGVGLRFANPTYALRPSLDSASIRRPSPPENQKRIWGPPFVVFSALAVKPPPFRLNDLLQISGAGEYSK
jgi:hypothetical protein